MQGVHRFSLVYRCEDSPRPTLDRSFGAPSIEDWVADLNPEEIRERLRAGLAAYVRDEQLRPMARPAVHFDFIEC